MRKRRAVEKIGTKHNKLNLLDGQTIDRYIVDGVVSVVDCANFLRINNFSRTAKIQAKCTDLVLLNKVELAGEENIEAVLDDLHELVPDAPKVRTLGDRAATDPGIVFGLDAALWRSSVGH